MKRLSVVLMMAVSAPVFGQSDAQAEKLFRAMEKKIREAKTVKLSFAMNADHSELFNVKGTVVVGEDNCVLMKAEGTIVESGMGESFVFSALGNSKKFIMKYDERVFANRENSPWMGRLCRTSIAHCGLIEFFGRFKVEYCKEYIEEWSHIGHLKCGGQELVDGTTAQVVEYNLPASFTWQNDRAIPSKEVLRCKIWINVETKLPIKGTISDDKGEGAITTTYHEFIVDEMVDPKLFELPQ